MISDAAIIQESLRMGRFSSGVFWRNDWEKREKEFIHRHASGVAPDRW